MFDVIHCIRILLSLGSSLTKLFFGKLTQNLLSFFVIFLLKFCKEEPEKDYTWTAVFFCCSITLKILSDNVLSALESWSSELL